MSILKQITEHRLPRDFDYHRCPAPWLQLKILRILGFLGRADQAASEQIYEVLLDVMRKAAEPAINIGYAIVFECVRTVTTLYPNAALLDAAAASIARFIQSDNHNLKCACRGARRWTCAAAPASTAERLTLATPPPLQTWA